MRLIQAILYGLMGLLICQAASAHMPGASPAPDVDLGPITLYDQGQLCTISLDDVAAYHGQREGKEPDACICCICMFRTASAGIDSLWGSEIPQRSDILITSSVISPGVVQTGGLITGTGTGLKCDNPGEFCVVLPNGSLKSGLSDKQVKAFSKVRSLDNYRFVITHISTGETVELSIADGIFPGDFFELRTKVKVAKNATAEEQERFASGWEEVRNAVLTMPDHELFSEIEEPVEEPDVAGGAVFLVILVSGALLAAFVMRKEK